MTNPDDQAFPRMGDSGHDFHLGMTIREHFAIMALQGILACDESGNSASDQAEKAVESADLLIKKLNSYKVKCTHCDDGYELADEDGIQVTRRCSDCGGSGYIEKE